MNNTMTSRIAKKIEKLHADIDLYVPSSEKRSIRIIAVTKYQPIELFSPLSLAGITDVGESRVIEALKRKEDVRDHFTWHLIGTLQKNKVSKAIRGFEYIHSVDSLSLAEAVNWQVEKYREKDRQKIFLQVNPLLEESKHGFSLDELHQNNELIYQLARLSHIEIVGLMAMAPERKEHGDRAVHQAFYATQELFTQLKKTVFKEAQSFKHLSMGMSQDYQIALQYGADFLRIGSFLFEGN